MNIVEKKILALFSFGGFYKEELQGQMQICKLYMKLDLQIF